MMAINLIAESCEVCEVRHAVTMASQVQARVCEGCAASEPVECVNCEDFVEATELDERGYCPACVAADIERYAAEADPVEHTKDSDCTIDENDSCTDCGVWHAYPCTECAGRGFHKDGCSEIEG